MVAILVTLADANSSTGKWKLSAASACLGSKRPSTGAEGSGIPQYRGSAKGVNKMGCTTNFAEQRHDGGVRHDAVGNTPGWLPPCPAIGAASPRTVESYAYAFQMFACFAAERLGVRPCNLVVEQLTAPLVLDFLAPCNANAATRSAPAMRGSPRSSRSSATWSTTCPRVPRHRQTYPCHTAETVDLPLIDYLDRDQVQSLLDVSHQVNTISY